MRGERVRKIKIEIGVLSFNPDSHPRVHLARVKPFFPREISFLPRLDSFFPITLTVLSRELFSQEKYILFRYHVEQNKEKMMFVSENLPLINYTYEQ